MKRSLIRAVLTAWAVLLFCVPEARPRAATVTLYLAGRIQGVDDPYALLDGSIVAGGAVSGSYTLDAAAVGAGAGKVEAYRFTSPGDGIRLKIGSYLFQSDPGRPQFTLSVAHAFNGDQYSLYSSRNVPLGSGLSVDSIAFSLVDLSQTSLASSALPATPPDLNRWRQYDLPMIVGSAPNSSPSKDPDAQDLEAPREFKIGIILDLISVTPQTPPASSLRPLHTSGFEQAGAVALMAERPAFAPGTLVPRTGDVDGDGAITVEDAAWALRYALGLAAPTPEQRDAADPDGDGRVDVRDAGLILRLALHLPVPI